MHLVVVANCQARPIASLIEMLSPAVKKITTIIVHLTKKDDAVDNYTLLDTADLIFAQFVSDQYVAGHLATSRLKERYGDRLISWPNIFFRGQAPDLAYASIQPSGELPGGRLLGPLREYHHRGIITAWQTSMTVNECQQFLKECPASFQEASMTISARSLEELEKRENSLDTKISDLIAKEWRQRRLFFTFNHPSAYLLTEMARRLLTCAGLNTVGDINSEREPLDLVIPPVFERDKLILGSALGQSDRSRGAELLIEGNKVQLGAIRFYTHSELIEATYHAYDMQISRENNLIFSPP